MHFYRDGNLRNYLDLHRKGAIQSIHVAFLADLAATSDLFSGAAADLSTINSQAVTSLSPLKLYVVGYAGPYDQSFSPIDADDADEQPYVRLFFQPFSRHLKPTIPPDSTPSTSSQAES